MPNEKLKKVYSYLQSKNSDFKVDYNTFEKDMSNPEKLKKVHSYLGTVNPDFKVDYGTFETDMGLKKNETPSQPSGDTLQKEPSEPTFGDQALGFISSVNRGFYGIVPDVLDAFALGGKAINNYVTAPLGIEGKIETLDQTPQGKLAKILREELYKATPIPEGTEDDFITQVGSGLGQVLGLAASGGAGAATKAGVAATTKTTTRAVTEKLIEATTSRVSQIASAQMSVAGFNRAKQEGATDDEAFGQAFASGLIGKTEAIPIGNAFARLDKVTGGRFKSTLVNGAKGGAEEFTQEAFQNYFENVSAQEIYDSQVPIMSGVVESGSVGGATGFIFNAFLTALGASKRGAKGDKLKALEQLETQAKAEYAKEEADFGAVKENILAKADAIDLQEITIEGNGQDSDTPTAEITQDGQGQPTTDTVLQEPVLGDTQITDGGTTTPAANQPVQQIEGAAQQQASQEPVQQDTGQVGQGTTETATPVLENVKVTHNQKDYDAKIEGGIVEFSDAEGNKVPRRIQDPKNPNKTISNGVYNKMQQKYAQSLTFNKGEKSNAIEAQTENTIRNIADTSENPSEIAQTWNNNKDEVTALDPKLQLIKDMASGAKVNRDSFINNADANDINMSMAKSYFDKNAMSIDQLAQSISTEEIEITPEDIVKAMKEFPNGFSSIKAKNPDIIALEDKFSQLTGLKLTPKNASLAIAQIKQETLQQNQNSEDFWKAFAIANTEGITLQNIESLKKDLFNGVVYDEQDYELIRQYLAEQAEADRIISENGGIADESEDVQPLEESEQDQVVTPVSQQGTADTPPTVVGEGVSSMEEGKKERKVAQRYMADPDVSDEVKSGLSEHGRFYIPTTNISRQADADAIVEAKGVDESIKMITDQDSGISEDTRVFVGKTLYKKLKEDVKSAETEAGKDVIRDKINKLVEDVAQLGTRAGQTVQAFSGMFTSDVEQVAHALRREAEKSKKKALKAAEGEIKTLQDVIATATDDAIKTLLQDPRIKSLLAESSKAKNVKVSKRKQFTKSLLDKLDAIERELDDTSNKAFDATYRLGVVIYKSAINIIRTAVKSGDSLADAVESAVSNIKQSVKDWDEVGFRKQFEKEIAQETKEDRKTLAEVLSESGDDFTSLALEHYTKYSSKKQTISEKLQEKFNMEVGEANRLAKTLDNIVAEKRKQLIEKRFANKISSPKQKKVAKNLAQRIAELTNLGGLSDNQTREVYAESVGLSGMSDEEAREMQRLVEMAESKPEGFGRYQAVQDMVKFHQKVNGYSWTEVVESIWYANMLSGISTQSLNFQANAIQTLGETFVGAVQAMVEYKNPNTALKNLSFMMKGLVDGYNKGLAESATALKEGYTPLKSQKFDRTNKLSGVRTAESDVLELMDKKNPLNYWKYVGRLMTATDILFYGGLKGMRSRQLAFRMAYNQNQNTYSKKMLSDANAFIGANDTALQMAKLKAEQEGFKGKEFDRRVNEIIDQSQPEALRDDANNFAAHGTFNYDPEGILGVMTSTINTATTRLPLLKVVVPFTRVISNVTNSYLDWTPWGLVRVAKGGMGIPNKASYKAFTQEEKLRELIKATTGTAAMVAMYALSQPGDDGEEPLIELTADGTGNLQKNYELGETGWKEYTFKMKGSDLRFEYRNTPLGIPFAIIGYLNDSKKYKGKDVTEDQLGLIFSGTLSYISDMSFLSGMSDFFQIISDKNNYGSIGEKLGVFAQRTAKTLVVPNLFTQTSRAIQEIVDSPMKKANNFYGQIARDMPVLRDDMGNLYNSLGEPIVADQLYKFNPIGTRFTSESDEKLKDSYKLWELIAETGAYIGSPSKTVKIYDPKTGTRRELEDEEYQKYALLAGQYTKKDLLSSYRTIMAQKDNDAKKKLINSIKEDARAKAKLKVFK